MSESRPYESYEPKKPEEFLAPENIDVAVRKHFEMNPSVVVQLPETLAKLGSDKLLTKRRQVEERLDILESLKGGSGNGRLSAELNDALLGRIETYQALWGAIADALEISADKARERGERKDQVALEKAHKRLSKSIEEDSKSKDKDDRQHKAA